MYFSFIPDVQYDTKPISYPFSESDYVIAKNFFRRYQVNSDVFSYAVFFKKYAVQDGERLDTVAEKAYDNPFFDWIIVLTNNIINPSFDWPLSSNDLRKYLEKEYSDPYNTIKHYKTITDSEQLQNYGQIVVKGDLIVDEHFYNSTIKYNTGSNILTVNANQLSYPVTIYEYEEELNQKKTEIYLLRPKYLDAFIEDFRKTNLYKKSSSYISTTLKQSNQ